MPVTGLRVVTFNVLPQLYQIVARWAEQTGNKIVLVVTTPGPTTRRTPSYRGVISSAPPEQDVLVTTRIRRVALPLIRELNPDLIVSASFPYRLPPELTALPRYGALNLHPAPLPAYRGPNPLRMFYDGYHTLGATLHRTEEAFDTGVIYSIKTAPMPDPLTPEAIFAIWPRLIMQSFAEGIESAIAGDPGIAQDHSQATYAAQFTEDEHWLDWSEPVRVAQRKVTAFNLTGGSNARAEIEGQPFAIQSVAPVTETATAVEPGTVINRTGETFVIRVADGLLRVVTQPIP